MRYECILLETAGPVARLSLNRPDKLNSFTVRMHEEIQDALNNIQGDQRVRVLVLTGTGRAFCAGQDLSETALAGAVDLGDSIQRYYAPLVRRLRALPVPVVCAVNGIAAGAGANLAFACDIVIAAKSAGFIESFCNLGLIPDTGGTYFLPRLIGTARAMGMAMLGTPVPAEQAAAWGLIWKCVDDVELWPEVDRLAAKLASSPPEALARIKQAIYTSAHQTLDQQLDLERDFMRELGNSADFREGLAAFLEKRPPRFERGSA